MKKQSKNIIIYSDDLNEYIENNNDVIIDYLNDNELSVNYTNKAEAAASLIDEDWLELADAIKRFDNKIKYNKIYVEASLGLWYGRIKAHGSFTSLFNAVYKCCEDSNTFYFKNNNTTLQLDAIHHDGGNCFKFYKVVNGRKHAIKINEFWNY